MNLAQPYIDIVSKIFSIAIMIQICIVYFFSSLHKLQGKLWTNGTALYYILNVDEFCASRLNKYITSSIYLVMFLTFSTILFQVSFPFLVWFKKTKIYILLIGVFFHLGIFVLMRVILAP